MLIETSKLAFVSGLPLLTLLLLGACSSSATGPSVTDASSDALLFPPPIDASAAVDAGEAAPATATTTLRVANLSPDLGPVDFCYRLVSGEWQGPVLTESGDGGAPIDGGDGGDGGDAATASPGLGFGNVSGYVTILGSGTFDLALVTAGDTSCGRPRAVGQVTLDAGKHTTVAAIGVESADAGSSSALSIVGFVDDPTIDSANARARTIHAALGAASSSALGAIAVAVTAANTTMALSSVVEPGHAASAATSPVAVDALGYHLATPQTAPAAFLVSPAESEAGTFSFTTAMADLRLKASSLHTAFVVSDPTHGIAVVWCDDTSSVTGPTTCSYLAAP